MLNYCELIVLLENSISDVNHGLKTFNAEQYITVGLIYRPPTNVWINTPEQYFGNTVLICAKFNNKTVENPECLWTVITGNSFSPQQYWFMEQAVAILATGQAASGKDAAHAASCASEQEDPKYLKKGRAEDPNPCTAFCFPQGFYYIAMKSPFLYSATPQCGTTNCGVLSGQWLHGL